jgi:hypothetical protein
MRKAVLLTAAVLTLAGLAAPVPVAAPEEPAWGKPVKGLRLGVRRGKAAQLMAVLENVGPDDLVVNLGLMLANGKKQLATAVGLTLTGADGKARPFSRKLVGVAGRVDPFVVPLASGCRYEVRCVLDQFAAADGDAPAAGRYQASAVFVGEAVTRDVNGDSGPRLMTYWTGTARSAEVTLTVPAK